MSKNNETKSSAMTKKAEPVEKYTGKTEEKVKPALPKWKKGDPTHGHSDYNLYGINGLWREKGCNELGGMKVRVYFTEKADGVIGKRNEKHTVVLTGTHEAGVTDLNMKALQKIGAKSRKHALELSRHPSTWSTKAKTIVEKMAAEKAKAEAEAKKAAEEEAKVEDKVEIPKKV